MTGRASKAEPARRADIIAFFGRVPPHTIHATVYRQGGKVVVIAGYWMQGDIAVVFADIDRTADISPFELWREATLFMKSIRRQGRCVAHAGSEGFLSRLGWTPTGPSDDGEVFEWNC